MAQYDVIAYGPDGARLNKGDVISGDSDVVDVYLQNGIVKYTPCDAVGATGMLYRWNGSAYQAVMDTQGDGTWFITPNTNPPDRITVVEASTDEVELAVEWDVWDLDVGYLGSPGIVYRDWVLSGFPNYDSGAALKYITDVRVVKSVIMRRGREGVFLGFHSDPRVGPLDSQIPAYNNATDWGEREFQTGGFARVAFSSAGVSGLHPDWGADSRWGGAGVYPAIRHLWLGIDDPNYPPYSDLAYIALQPAGFPAEQETGPWWIAQIHANNATTFPFCQYMVLRERLEIGSHQFDAISYGFPTLHFANEAHDAANVPYRTMCFVGAFPYVSANLSLEPTATLRAAVANRANEDFELSGQAEIAVSTTTISQVRDRMIRQLETATPALMTNRKFVAYREDVEFTDFCERSPDASTRRFTIRDTFPGTTTTSTIDLREIHTVIEVVVAYPKRGAFRNAGTSRPILELNDIVRSDFQVMREVIGIRGYAALEQDGVNACVTGEEWSVEQGTACVYSVLRLPVMYREIPL